MIFPFPVADKVAPCYEYYGLGNVSELQSVILLSRNRSQENRKNNHK